MSDLPISVPIGEMAKGRERVLRFAPGVDCVLGRLHVESSPVPSPDQQGVIDVLHDVDVELEQATEEKRVAYLINARDRLLEQLEDRVWTPTREVAITELSIGGEPSTLQDNLSAILTDPGIGSRDVLPISTGVPIKPGQSFEVVARPQRGALVLDRFMISNAGTPGGAGDWAVTDVMIGNRSQFAQAGDISGAMFATDAIDTFLSFEAVSTAMDVRVTARYDGPVEEGVPFFASFVGHLRDGWGGIRVKVGQRVSIKIRNDGEATELRAVWNASRAPMYPANLGDMDLGYEVDDEDFYEEELTPT